MRASAGKGVENSQIGKGKKGKEGKGTYRSQTTENPKGKGGGSGKDEKKDSWPKKCLASLRIQMWLTQKVPIGREKLWEKGLFHLPKKK
jgi:hypothetical protein